MTGPPDCGHGVTVSGRVLALLTTPAALRRLRIAHRADPRLYGDLLTVSAVVLGAANGTKIAIGNSTRDAGLMTATEYAAAMGITPRAVRRACAENRITGAVKTAGVWLIPAGQLAARETAC